MAGPEILIFDDDASLGNMTLDAVESSGYQAQLYRDGTRVLSLVEELHPRLVVLDIMMPGLDGLSACKTLRAHPGLKGLRIVVISGKTVGKVDEQAARLGADLFIPKPYDPLRFLEAVRGLIGEPAGVTPEAAGDPVFVSVLGDRSSGLTSVALEAGELLLLLDAGSGLTKVAPLLGDRKELRLLLTHYHPDHVEGLGALKGTNLPLTICGPNDAETPLTGVVESALGKAPVKLFTVVEGTFALAAGVHLSALYVNHPGTVLAVSISVFGKKIVYCPDNEVRAPKPGRMRDIEDKLKAFARDADLLIHDARYSPADYEKHLDEGHSAYPTVVDLAIDAGVKRLMLFHLDAAYRPDEIAGLCQAAQAQAAGQLTTMEVVAPVDGSRLAL